jgi:hypothetical protein
MRKFSTIAISILSLNWVSFSFHMDRVIIIYNFDIKLNSGGQKPDENYVEDKAFILVPLLKGNWSIIQTDAFYFHRQLGVHVN